MTDDNKKSAIAVISQELTAVRESATNSLPSHVTQLGLANTTDAVRAVQDRLGRIARGEVDVVSGWAERKFVLEPAIKLGDTTVAHIQAVGRVIDAQNDLTRKATINLEVSAGYQAAMLMHGVSIFTISREIMHHANRQAIRHDTELEHDRLLLEAARQEHQKLRLSFQPVVNQHVAREVAAQLEAEADVAAARAAQPIANQGTTSPATTDPLRLLQQMEVNALAANDVELASRLQAALSAFTATKVKR